MTAPDLSTLDRRIIYAAKVLQEAYTKDAEFHQIYHTCFAHNGRLLNAVLHDLAAKIHAESAAQKEQQ